MEKITFDNIPVWAIYWLEYGKDESLEEDDVKAVTHFIEENLPKGYLMDVDWESEGFSWYPAFGLPCNTLHVDFYV